LIAAAKGGLTAVPENRRRWALHHHLPSIELLIQKTISNSLSIQDTQ
jgi:hypothetical protein